MGVYVGVSEATFSNKFLVFRRGTSGWELGGSRAMSGLSEEPGRRYSGGAASWLVDSVFVLLNERFRLFPFGKLESAPVS